MKPSTLPLLVLGLLMLAAIIAAGCTGSTAAPAAGDIKKFSSADEIRDYIKNNTALAGETVYLDGGVWARDTATAPPVPAVAESAGKGITVPQAAPGGMQGPRTILSPMYRWPA
jgi:hypothetical protein